MLRAYLKQHIAGLHYAVRIFIGTTFLWVLLRNEQTSDSLWAMISLIVVTETQTQPAWIAFRARFINTVIGSVIGLGFLLIPLPQVWLLTPAITTSALIATYMNRVQQGWRIAPITTGIIMSAAMTQHSTSIILELALHRTMEVFLGSITAVAITAVMATLWLPAEAKA